MADRLHWICGNVSPEAFRLAKCPPRFKWARLGVVPSIAGNEFQIAIGALVEALNPSDAMDRFRRVYPGASIEFCSPKPNGFYPAGFMNWHSSE